VRYDRARQVARSTILFRVQSAADYRPIPSTRPRYNTLRRKNGERCLRILIASANIITVALGSRRQDGKKEREREREGERERGGGGKGGRETTATGIRHPTNGRERMAEINVEKVSSIKTVTSFNHRAEIILKAGVNIPHPVARRMRSPRDEDFESAPLPATWPLLHCSRR